MEIKIGIRHISREISIDTNETAEKVRSKVTDAIHNGTMLEITDEKGATTFVPGAQIGYVELGTEEKRHIGFGFSGSTLPQHARTRRFLFRADAGFCTLAMNIFPRHHGE